MVDVIQEPVRCEACGTYLPSPADGQWRWAKGGKTYESIEEAEQKISQLRITTHEFRAAVDAEGRVRIASRRLATAAG